MDAAGLKSQDGLNSGKLNGYSATTVTIDPRTETRSSSETSFLRAALRTSSLKVYQKTLGKKILFNAQKKATGVVVQTNGKTYTLSARKEIVVANGVFQSPQLLMVSGIGPAAVLKQFNIPAVSVLEGVGQNMIDQTFFAITYQVNVTTSSQLNSNPDFNAKAVQSFKTSQTGPLANVNGDLLGWEKIPQPNRSKFSAATIQQLSQFPSDWPEVEYAPFDNAVPPAGAAPTDNFIQFGAALVAPISKGNISITSTDTNVKPLINPNWLAAKADQEVAIQAFRRIRQIAEASGAIVKEVAPGPNVQSDADVLKWIQDNATLIYHASATCSMGRSTDSNAVIDSRARVRGVTGLRVVDASSFPILPPGHPQAVVYMLAEKIADDMKNNASP